MCNVLAQCAVATQCEQGIVCMMYVYTQPIPMLCMMYMYVRIYTAYTYAVYDVYTYVYTQPIPMR